MRIFLRSTYDKTLAEGVNGINYHYGPANFRIVSQRITQTQQFIGSEHVQVKDRQNNSYAITFSASCEYSALKNAETALVTWQTIIPRAGELWIGCKSDGSGYIYYKMVNAVVEQVTGQQNGVAVIWTYRIIGGQITKV